MPDIYTLASQFRSALLRNERAAATELVQAYAEVWRTLKNRVARLTDEIAQARARGEIVSQSWLLQFNRLTSFQFQVEQELRKFVAFADPLILHQQREAVLAAQSHAEQLLLFNFQNAPAEATAAVSASFNRLPVSATQAIVGFVGNGSPLRKLLDALPDDGGERVRSALIQAVALGRSPKRIGKDIQDALGGNLSRALTIARTETIRAYREASHLTYEANQDVLSGWVWTAKLGATTCLLCIAMHGSEHDAKERLESHPNCRCVMVPKTKSWAELGFDGIPDTTAKIETGQQWFARQDAATQKQILGVDGYKAFQAGQVRLADFIGRKRKSAWGKPYYRRSLSEALQNRSETAPELPAAGEPKTSLTAAGKAVSVALTLPTRGKLATTGQRVSKAIDAVHGDGDLHPIPVEMVRSRKYQGAFWHSPDLRRPGKRKAVKITLSSSANSWPHVSIAHEVGHLLDLHGAADGVYSSGTAELFADWRRAIQQSKAFQLLTEMKSKRGRGYSPAHVEYLLRWHELWARSYSQFVAVRSGDAVLLEEINLMRKRAGDVYYPHQWDDDDFAPVEAAIEQLMLKLGWMKQAG